MTRSAAWTSPQSGCSPADKTAKQLRAMEIFKASDAFLEGHFVYTSGRHGKAYLEKFRILERAEHTEPLCRMIAAVFADSGAEVVAGPTTGGIILAYEVGRILGCPASSAKRTRRAAGPSAAGSASSRARRCWWWTTS